MLDARCRRVIKSKMVLLLFFTIMDGRAGWGRYCIHWRKCISKGEAYAGGDEAGTMRTSKWMSRKFAIKQVMEYGRKGLVQNIRAQIDALHDGIITNLATIRIFY